MNGTGSAIFTTNFRRSWLNLVKNDRHGRFSVVAMGKGLYLHCTPHCNNVALSYHTQKLQSNIKLPIFWPEASLRARILLSRSIMATMFDPSLSTGAMHRHSMLHDTPSMADSLPSINFGFNDLRDRMARFTEKFDSFIAKGRMRVLEERNQFRTNVAELQGMQCWQEKSSCHQLMLFV